MSDINGGQSPNPNGSPIWPGTVFNGPLIAGNVVHSDGSGTLAGVGETTGTANQGYVNMSQSQAGVNSSATTFTTNIVIPAQSQITDIYMMVTTAQAGATFGVGVTAGSATAALVPLTSGVTTTIGQLATTLLPVTAPQVANWDNVGNQDVQLTVTFSATGAFVGTLTVFYIQGINNAS